MSGFPILDLVIGIFFIFFVLSIISSSIVEIIITAAGVRAKVLGQWLLRIFDTPIQDPKSPPDSPPGKSSTLGQEIMNHCALTALSDPNKAPSYIDAKNFVSALLDKVFTFSNVTAPKSIDDIIASIESSTVLSGELKRTFLIYANEAKDTVKTITTKTTGEIELFRAKIENWYDSNMDRLTGTLKMKYTRKITMATGIIVCIALNADTIEIAKYLYTNPEARTKLAAKADEVVKDSTYINKVAELKEYAKSVKDTVSKNKIELSADDLEQSITKKVADINDANAVLQASLPLGWNVNEFHFADGWVFLRFLLSKIAGLAVTVAAVMMGAPFWFDVLNKISNVRGAGTKPKKSNK